MGINLLPTGGKAFSHGRNGENPSSVGISYAIFQDGIVMVDKDIRIGNFSRDPLMLCLGMGIALRGHDHRHTGFFRPLKVFLPKAMGNRLVHKKQ